MAKVKMKTKSLKVAIMETAIARLPESEPVLTSVEEKTLERYVEKVIEEMLKRHGDNERAGFEVSRDELGDHLEAFFATQDRLKDSLALQKKATSTAKKLVADWEVFIRRSEMIKQLQLSAQEFVNSLR